MTDGKSDLARRDGQIAQLHRDPALAGMYLVRFGHDSVTCTANSLYGYPVTAFQGQDPSSVQAEVVVPVFARMVTAPVSVTCTQ